MGGADRPETPARFLPLTWTAEMCLAHLADTGDADAAALFAALGLDAEEIVDSPATILSPEYRLTRTLLLESRRRVTDALAAESGGLLVDLPCGLTPRGLTAARAGRPYLGLDLPPVAEAMERAALPLIGEARRALVRYAAVDATDPDALVRAVGERGGELCVVTEGLLMYLSREDTRRLCEGIGRLLALRGGCWITADPEQPRHSFRILTALWGERLPELLQRGFERKPVRSGRLLPERPPDKSPLQLELRGGLREQLDEAEALLASCALRAERLPMAGYLSAPLLPGRLLPAQEDALREALGSVCCWRITPA